MESDNRQHPRIDTTVGSSTSITNDAATTASPVAMTPASAAATTPTPISATVLARSGSTTSRFSRISQGTRRSRFVEALDDDRDDDLDQHYETGTYRGRSSIATRSIRSVASYASLQQRRRSRSSSLGIETGGPARGSSVPAVGGEGSASSRGLVTADGVTPTSGKRQVSFGFPLLPPHSGSDTTGTPTTPGFNDRTGGTSNPFSDVYGTADTPRSMNQSTASLVRDVDGMDYMEERPKGGFDADAKGVEAGVPSPKLAYFFERNPQQYGELSLPVYKDEVWSREPWLRGIAPFCADDSTLFRTKQPILGVHFLFGGTTRYIWRSRLIFLQALTRLSIARQEDTSSEPDG